MSGYIGPKSADVPVGTIATKGTLSGNSLLIGTNNATIGNSVYVVANGNVGIRTSAPTSFLDLGNTAGGRITGDFTSGIANRLAFQTSTVDSATSVSALPNGTGIGSGFSAFSTSLGTNSSAVSIGSNTVEATIATFNNGSSNSLPVVFRVPIGQERMRITTDGKVGIGTSSPSSILDVVGDNQYIQQRNATTAGVSSVWAMDNGFWSTPTYRGIAIQQYGSTSNQTLLGTINSNNAGVLVFQNQATGIIYTNGGTPLLFGTLNAERMRIDAAGNIGIGNSSPISRLHVYANNSYGSASLVTVQGNSTNAAGIAINNDNVSTYGTIYSYGNTGYGVTSWANSFVIEGVPIDSSSATVLGSYRGNLIFQTGGRSNRMAIVANGNVGIGTASPARLFEVAGSIRFQSGGVIECGSPDLNTYIAAINGTNGYWAFATNATEKMRIANNGNVSIGNTSSIAKLHVEGEVFSGRVDTSVEGGQIGFGRSSDNARLYAIDCYGSGSNPELRMFNDLGAIVFFSASNTGVNYLKFNPTQAAQGDANCLDDYEEGTWTPTWVGSTSNPTVSYAQQYGSYVKIGRMVHLSFRLGTSAFSGGSGGLMMGGLPFNVDNSGYNTWSGIIGWNGGSFSNNQHMISVEGAQNGTILYCHYITSTGQTADIAIGTGTNATMFVEGSISYRTS